MTILLLGRHEELSAYRTEALKAAGFHVLSPKTRQDAVTHISDGRFELVVLSYSLSDDTAQELAELVRQNCSQCPIVAIAEHGWDDGRIKPDEIVIGSQGPEALIESVRRASRGKLRRVK